ncbi:uncharacterized protein SOCE26_031580 [Sorangium cellulosum]|uniref:Uncharacterized protein n=1 Tax=Sorangium cellulosum TaxID=56 RepID=A0A2L0ER32_SORCE|nr:uncharacterized protein SOCE26_031580 [Sorangium cellulosum]
MPGSPCSRAGDTGARCAPPQDGQLFAAEPLTHNDGGSGFGARVARAAKATYLPARLALACAIRGAALGRAYIRSM